MIAQKDPKAERKLRRLEAARALTGVGVIIVMAAVVLVGMDAFTKEKDAWVAMKLPLTIAALLIWGFARSTAAAVALKATLGPPMSVLILRS